MSLTTSVLGFIAAAAVIGVCGVLMTIRAEHLARTTGLGQAFMGAVFIGASTSLSGLVTSGSAAFAGHASLAASNGLGGIAAQTMFLALADIVYRKANLEHAAASEVNLQQNALLIVMLTMPLIALSVPELTIGWVHPISVLLVVAYISGLYLVHHAYEHPMWFPRYTRQTEREEPSSKGRKRATFSDWTVFLLLAGIVAVAGWVIAECGIALSRHAALEESIVGGVLTSISTSLPELVIAVTAVRRGALTLAVGDILGGNTFDVLFLSVSDALYLDGSIYSALGRDEILWAAVSLLLAGILMMGLLRREKFGIGNIGFESALVLLIYFAALVTLIVV
jgi:cation:H+ antiporter